MQDKQGGAGWVGDEVIVLRRGLLDGTAVKGNRIQPASFRPDEFRFRDGWSCFQFFNKADAAEKTKEYSARKSKEAGREKNYGYALVSVGEIRSITDTAGRPAVLVVATPSKEHPDHISIQRARDYDKIETDDIREQLIELLGDVVIPE